MDYARMITHRSQFSATGRKRRLLPPNNKEIDMLNWALIFFIIAVIAAVLGFGGVAGAAAGIAKILFFIFLALLVISLIAGAFRGRSPKV